MDLPYVNFLTEIASGPALAVFALLRKQKHRCELQIPTILPFDLPYVNFLTEIVSGPALAVFALLRKQKHRCELQIPTRHKAVYAAPLFAKKKAPVRVLFNWRRGSPLNFRQSGSVLVA